MTANHGGVVAGLRSHARTQAFSTYLLITTRRRIMEFVIVEGGDYLQARGHTPEAVQQAVAALPQRQLTRKATEITLVLEGENVTVTHQVVGRREARRVEIRIVPEVSETPPFYVVTRSGRTLLGDRNISVAHFVAALTAFHGEHPVGSDVTSVYAAQGGPREFNVTWYWHQVAVLARPLLARYSLTRWGFVAVTITQPGMSYEPETVVKVQLPDEPEGTLSLPRGAKIIHVAVDDGRRYVWAVVAPLAPPEDRTIWRLELPGADYFTLSMPVGAQIIHVAAEDEVGYLWAVVDAGAKRENRTFAQAGAGLPLPGMPLRPVGSYHPVPGVWLHVFEALAGGESTTARHGA
jgi:hypothetical protein